APHRPGHPTLMSTARTVQPTRSRPAGGTYQTEPGCGYHRATTNWSDRSAAVVHSPNSRRQGHIMKVPSIICLFILVGSLALFSQLSAAPEEAAALPKACIDGTAPGWRELAEQHFVNVNCNPDTWSWKDG